MTHRFFTSLINEFNKPIILYSCRRRLHTIVRDFPQSISLSYKAIHIKYCNQTLARTSHNDEGNSNTFDSNSKIEDAPSEKVKILTQQLLSLNVIEVTQLLDILQDRLGVTDENLYKKTGMNRSGADFSHLGKPISISNIGSKSQAESSKAANDTQISPATEKTSFDLKLTVVDAKVKIKIIKEVRTITGLGLKEAKELVEKAPVVVKQGLKKEEAENFKKVLLDAGAQVEVS